MVSARVLFTFVVVCVLGARAQMSSCASSQTYVISIDTSVFGCSGYANSVSVVWQLNATDPRVLTFTAMNTENNYDKVTLTQGSLQYGPFSGTINPGSFDFLGGLITVSFNSDGSNTDPGFTISMMPTPDVTVLQSAQPLTMQPKQDGGFVYFALVGESSGANFYVDTLIHAYEGLQPPAMFISVNRFPTLESYDFTNSTVEFGDGYQAFFQTDSPRDGTWYIGLFLYGTSTDIDILAQWSYGLPFLTSGQKVTNSTAPGNPMLYQVLVPDETTQLVWQISRQLPGGYPIAYIAQGTVASASNYGWVMDTTQQSYIKLIIQNPNPYNNPSANPGNYIIAIYEKQTLEKENIKTESFEPLTSGFILECDYSF